jgi:hypothetical protein
MRLSHGPGSVAVPWIAIFSSTAIVLKLTFKVFDVLQNRLKIKTMRVEIVKRPDGSGVLRCTRIDGSVTWQKQDRHAAHFALHDMTHYAVETTLGYKQGFFGLIAAGWNLADVTGKGARGPLPPEATEVEGIVGVFDSERASGSLWTAEEFERFALRTLTADQIQGIRALRANLFRQWREVLPGQTLVLQFEP